MKKIVRLTENDLAKIVRRVINERQYLMEGVPNTTLTADNPITVASRTVCATKDYIKVSFIVTNSGTEDAYLSNFPYLTNRGQAKVFTANEFNVTIGGKPQVGQADGQNQPKIPKGKKATINMVIYTDLSNFKAGTPEMQTALANLKNLKSGTIVVRYNGTDLQIPVTFGGFMIDASRSCDAAITLPKGF